MENKTIEQSHKNVRFGQYFELFFARLDFLQLQAEIIRNSKNRGQIARPELFAENTESFGWIVARKLEEFRGLNPGDQEMRAQMTHAAAIENTDVLSLGQREQSFDKFICGKRNLVHSADFIMDRF